MQGLHLLRCVCLSGAIFTSLSHLGLLSSVLTLLIVFMSGGSQILVSGAEGQDLDLVSKIPMSVLGVNNSGLRRKQWSLSPWSERDCLSIPCGQRGSR